MLPFGPISIEWDDAGMDRLVGAAEAVRVVRGSSLAAPAAAFAASLASRD